MREHPESRVKTTLAKIRTEGVLTTLTEAPRWILRTAITEAILALRRHYRRRGYRRTGFEAIPDPTETIDIDPANVTHLVPYSRFGDTPPRTLLGTIKGGDWDIDLQHIESQPKYQACRSRVMEGVPWEETRIIDHLATELEASDAHSIEHGCDSRAALLERYETTRETLYRSLRDEGYDRSTSPVCCRIHIGRDGSLLLGDGGHHRFYLSRLLSIESVPVQVLCRHRQWQAVRETVAKADSIEALPSDIRACLDHPDLRTLRPAPKASAE